MDKRTICQISGPPSASNVNLSGKILCRPLNGNRHKPSTDVETVYSIIFLNRVRRTSIEDVDIDGKTSFKRPWVSSVRLLNSIALCMN